MKQSEIEKHVKVSNKKERDHEEDTGVKTPMSYVKEEEARKLREKKVRID